MDQKDSLSNKINIHISWGCILNKLNKIFNIGIVITCCSGLIMLFTYFVGNELLKQISGVREVLYLNRFLLLIAGVVVLFGLAIVVYSWDKISRKHYYDK